MTQPTIARGAPQTDAEMIAALEQHMENYRIACEGFTHGAQVAAERIAALEAQIEASHRVIDTFGLSRCADSHEGRDANGCVTCDDGKPPLSLAERTKWLIDMMPDYCESDTPCVLATELHDRVAALEAENAVLKAERNEAQQQVGSLTFQRDALRKTLNQWIFEASDRRIALEAARQSRARLVRLVRELQDWRTLAYKYHRICLKAESERDAARAWAAAWKRAATFWRGWRDMPYTYCRDRDFVFGGARRAAEAAEAMERG